MAPAARSAPVDISIIQHLRAQAARYDRLARTLDPRSDGSFPRTMADGYLAAAERYARIAADAGYALAAPPKWRFTPDHRRTMAVRSRPVAGQSD